MLSCSIWFSAPSFWMGGGLESRCVGRVYGVDVARHGGRCVGLTTLPLSCTDCLDIWEPQPPGTLWACPGLQWDCFTVL